MIEDRDEVEQRYKELVASCWAIFANEHAAAARISMMFEAYPEIALRKLQERPEFFGPLRDEKVSLIEDVALRSSTALDIRERLRDFRDAVDEQAKQEEREKDREQGRRRRRERDR